MAHLVKHEHWAVEYADYNIEQGIEQGALHYIFINTGVLCACVRIGDGVDLRFSVMTRSLASVRSLFDHFLLALELSRIPVGLVNILHTLDKKIALFCTVSFHTKYRPPNPLSPPQGAEE